MYNSIHNNLGFHWDSRYAVTVTVNTGGSALMNTRIAAEGQTVTVNYFTGTQIKITAQPHGGYTVDYWLVNGERREGDFITVRETAEVAVYFKLN
jgi:hypothetical protein